MRRNIMTLALMLISLPLLADIHIRTNITDVLVAQDGQLTGLIVFVVDGDDFAAASPETPMYLRLSWSHGATNAHTLVAPQTEGLGQTLDSRPIALPIRSLGGQVLAPADTVALVRDVRGEGALWLRIQRSSSSWLATGAPTPEGPVEINLGQAAAISDESSRELFEEGLANLPGSRRDLDQLGPGYTLSTLNCVNLVNSSLEPVPAPEALSILRFDPMVFDHTTVGVTTAATEDDITLGAQVAITFSNDTRVARGQAAEDAYASQLLIPDTQQPLCIDHQRPDDNPLLVSMVARHGYRVSAPHGYLTGSSTILQIQNDETVGVAVALDAKGDPILSRTVDGVNYYQLAGVGNLPGATLASTFDTPEDATFFLHGTMLSHKMVITALESAEFSAEISFSMEIFTAAEEPTLTPTAFTFFSVAQPTFYWPDPPFDGTGDDGDPNTGVTAADQAYGCAQPDILLGGFDFTLGTFLQADCPAPTPTQAAYTTLLPQVEPDQHLELTFTRDHNITQILALTYTSPEGDTVTHQAVLDQPTVTLSSLDKAWFGPSGTTAPFPNFGGRLSIVNPDHAPFHVTAQLITPTRTHHVPFTASGWDGSIRYQRIPAFQTNTVELLAFADNVAGTIQLTGLEADGRQWRADDISVPKGGVVRINLNDLTWTSALGGAAPGNGPMLITLQSDRDGMLTMLVADENNDPRLLEPLDHDAMFKTKQGFPLIAPIDGTSNATTFRLTRDPAADVAIPPTVTLKIWENRNGEWYLNLPLDQPLKSFSMRQQDGILSIYDDDTDTHYYWLPSPGTTTVLLTSIAPAELTMFSEVGVHAEVFNQDSFFGTEQRARDLLDTADQRLSYAPGAGLSHQILVNSFSDDHAGHMLYFQESDGDVFQLSLLGTESGQGGDRLDLVRLSPGMVTFSRNGQEIQLVPQRLAGTGDFYDAPASVDSAGGAALTLLTHTENVTAPLYTPSGRVNNTALRWVSKPLPGDTQVQLQSLAGNMVYRLTQTPFFDLGVLYSGMTQPGGLTTIDIETVLTDNTFDLGLRASTASNAYTFERAHLQLGYLDVSAGPDQVLSEEEATFTARVNADGVEPAGIEWAWYHDGRLVGENPQLTTSTPGLYRIEIRHGEQRFRASDEAWLLIRQPDGVITPYLQDWAYTVTIQDLVGLINTRD